MEDFRNLGCLSLKEGLRSTLRSDFSTIVAALESTSNGFSDSSVFVVDFTDIPVTKEFLLDDLYKMLNLLIQIMEPSWNFTF